LSTKKTWRFNYAWSLLIVYVYKKIILAGLEYWATGGDAFHITNCEEYQQTNIKGGAEFSSKALSSKIESTAQWSCYFEFLIVTTLLTFEGILSLCSLSRRCLLLIIRIFENCQHCIDCYGQI
jgi:hypothetical protein